MCGHLQKPLLCECPACGRPDTEAVRHPGLNDPVHGRYNLYRCVNCGKFKVSTSTQVALWLDLYRGAKFWVDQDGDRWLLVR